jgi:hypothetical protein
VRGLNSNFLRIIDPCGRRYERCMLVSIAVCSLVLTEQGGYGLLSSLEQLYYPKRFVTVVRVKEREGGGNQFPSLKNKTHIKLLFDYGARLGKSC